MNSNRHALRSTENQFQFNKLSSTNEIFNKTKFNSNEQENFIEKKILTTSRPILTAIRSIKRQSLKNENDNQMFISPMVKTNFKTKTHEQLEEELFEVSDYRQSIFEHLKSIEHLYTPKIHFMEQQSDINSAMRTILIDWLIEVSDEYKLIDETLFLCVQYVDRFLSKVNITRSKLQLIGTTCMYLASKYEEMYPPALEDFSFITDNTYETKHILRMEQIVIKMLNFSLSGPTCYTFLQHYLTNLKIILSIDDNDNDDYKSLSMLSNYFSILTLLDDQQFLTYSLSKIAASCLLLSIELLKLTKIFSNDFIQITSYSENELNQCKSKLRDIYLKTYEQDKITSSLLRRYLNKTKDNDLYKQRVREIIHCSKSNDDDDDDDNDDILDLTLDEFDENKMSMDRNR